MRSIESGEGRPTSKAWGGHIQTEREKQEDEKVMKMMNKTTVFAVLMAILLCGAYAWAEEEAPSGGADVAFMSQYVWRGYALSDSSIVIQPSISAGYKGFGLNLWGNLDTDYYDMGKDFNETDLTLSYDKSYGMV
jgi:hypothetical protein